MKKVNLLSKTEMKRVLGGGVPDDGGDGGPLDGLFCDPTCASNLICCNGKCVIPDLSHNPSGGTFKTCPK